MTEKETLALYEKTGALMRGHFRLTSGLHSDVYLQSALVLQYPEHAAALGAALAAPFREADVDGAGARDRRHPGGPRGGARPRRALPLHRAGERRDDAAPRLHALRGRALPRRRGRH